MTHVRLDVCDDLQLALPALQRSCPHLARLTLIGCSVGDVQIYSATQARFLEGAPPARVGVGPGDLHSSLAAAGAGMQRLRRMVAPTVHVAFKVE